MSYYVHTTNCNFIIPGDQVEAADAALRELNNRNDLKRGGSFPNKEDLDNDKPRPDKWFSWMPWNYHEKDVCPDLESILNEVGFACSVADDGTLEVDYYEESKMGNEREFIEALAPFAMHGSYMNWEGEDGDRWRWEVHDGQLKHLVGETTWREL